MGVVEIRRLKQIEEENAKLKRLVANLTLDKTKLQGTDQTADRGRTIASPREAVVRSQELLRDWRPPRALEGPRCLLLKVFHLKPAERSRGSSASIVPRDATSMMLVARRGDVG